MNKDIKDLNSIINPLDQTDLYRAFYPITAEYTFFSSIYGRFYCIAFVIVKSQN